MTEETPKKEDYNVKSTVPFKLKDKVGRGGIGFDIYKTFGFYPKTIIIQKVTGQHDKFILSAVVEKEDEIAKAAEKGGALE
jgi:hypothetical protein